jgi:hypothetical protein
VCVFLLCIMMAASTPLASLGILPSVIPDLPLVGGGAVSLPVLPPTASTPASTTPISHLLAAGDLGVNPSGMASSAADSGLASFLMQALLGTPHPAPAVATIPKNLLLQIRRGEYVDFADLLPAFNAADHSSALGGQVARFSLLPGYEVVRRRRRNISNITDWMQAFLVYSGSGVRRPIADAGATGLRPNCHPGQPEL